VQLIILSINLKIFCQCIEIINNKEILKEEGLKYFKPLAAGMISTRTSFYS